MAGGHWPDDATAGGAFQGRKKMVEVEGTSPFHLDESA
jgi:hypothetical protein